MRSAVIAECAAQIVFCDGSFTQNLDFTSRAIHERGWNATGGFAAINDQVNPSSKLNQHLLRRGGTGLTGNVRRGDSHGSRSAKQGARHFMVRYAYPHGGCGRDGFGEVNAFREENGQRSGPEAGGKSARGVWNLRRDSWEVSRVANQDGDRFLDGAVLCRVD